MPTEGWLRKLIDAVKGNIKDSVLIAPLAAGITAAVVAVGVYLWSVATSWSGPLALVLAMVSGAVVLLVGPRFVQVPVVKKAWEARHWLKRERHKLLVGVVIAAFLGLFWCAGEISRLYTQLGEESAKNAALSLDKDNALKSRDLLQERVTALLQRPPDLVFLSSPVVQLSGSTRGAAQPASQPPLLSVRKTTCSHDVATRVVSVFVAVGNMGQRATQVASEVYLLHGDNVSLNQARRISTLAPQQQLEYSNKLPLPQEVYDAWVAGTFSLGLRLIFNYSDAGKAKTHIVEVMAKPALEYMDMVRNETVDK